MDKNYSTYFSTQSHMIRVLLLGFLVILLQFPIMMIESIVTDREQAESSAINDVQSKWGNQQHIRGPILILPYQKDVTNVAANPPLISNTVTHYAAFFPDTLDVNAKLQSDTRSRGIYQVPLYQSELLIKATFSKLDLAALGIEENEIEWKKAKLVVLVSDARAIQERAQLQWDEASLNFEPGSDSFLQNQSGYHVLLKSLSADKLSREFSIRLNLNGSGGLYFAPLGKDSRLDIQSNWRAPSFQGDLLPSKRDVDEAGFKAHWRIPYLARNYPSQTINYSEIHSDIVQSEVGVNLITPVDKYQMVERSLKYKLMIFGLTFMVIWLFEVLNKLRVHFIQYLFVGMALCIFYLLELSLSEHIGFYTAYAFASVTIIALTALYSKVILGNGRRAAIIAASMSALYAYLFSLLQEQNYALLIGSFGLLILLAVVMYSTRNIDWFELSEKSMRILDETGGESKVNLS